MDRIRYQRLVSFEHRHMAVILYEITLLKPMHLD